MGCEFCCYKILVYGYWCKKISICGCWRLLKFFWCGEGCFDPEEWVSLHRVLLTRQRKGDEFLSIDNAFDKCAVGQLKEIERKWFVSTTKESLKLDKSEDGALSKHLTGSKVTMAKWWNRTHTQSKHLRENIKNAWKHSMHDPKWGSWLKWSRDYQTIALVS